MLDGEAKTIAKQAKKIWPALCQRSCGKDQNWGYKFDKDQPHLSGVSRKHAHVNVQNSCDNLQLEAINKAEQDQGAVTNDLGLVRRGLKCT